MAFRRTLLIAATAAIVAAAAWSQDIATPAAEAESATAPADPNTPVESSRSPFDYEASEEISEDLSVSFPVDI